MASTLLADLFDPEIATEVATAEFPNQLALGFAGSPFVRAFPPEDSMGEEGEQVKFPRYDALGEFDELGEDSAMTPEKLRSSKDFATVQAAGKAVEITDFADLASRGDPSAEVGRQMARLGSRYIDARLIDAAAASPLSHTVSQTFTWEVFVDALIDQWGDRAMENVGGVVFHSKVMGDVMKLPEFKRADQLGDQPTTTRGFQGMIGGYPAFVSDRLKVTSGSPNTYTNAVLKRGALGLKFQRTLLVEQDRDILKKSDVIAGDVRFATHLFFAEPRPVIRLVTQ